MAKKTNIVFLTGLILTFGFTNVEMASRSMTGLRCRWLLFSDIHFKHHDLDRVRKTASWIIEEAERHQIQRVVVCGDLLTSRTMQPTHVLSECYRFINRLSDVVPQIHILFGNHDLAYRRDYQTTALDALNFKRLVPYVSLHSDVTHYEWEWSARHTGAVSRGTKRAD
jgi:DNA repair exonuclease SbcCD nuclease subunit